MLTLTATIDTRDLNPEDVDVSVLKQRIAAALRDLASSVVVIEGLATPGPLTATKEYGYKGAFLREIRVRCACEDSDDDDMHMTTGIARRAAVLVDTLL
jgi:hypothetical protein